MLDKLLKVLSAGRPSSWLRTTSAETLSPCTCPAQSATHTAIGCLLQTSAEAYILSVAEAPLTSALSEMVLHSYCLWHLVRLMPNAEVELEASYALLNVLGAVPRQTGRADGLR